jgi:repressor LexA
VKKGRLPLTERQQEVMALIEQSIIEKRVPPSVREIGNAQGINVNAIVGHLRALERKGYIRRHANLARGIEILVGS